jgi:tripartite-type tricarboxylate transporter receptor subunit TctC
MRTMPPAALAALTGLLLVPCAPGWAQTDYPNHAVRVIAQFQPGTSTDLAARVIAQKLSEAWHQQVIVDNRPGAAGIVGTEIGAKAAADGYTLTMGVSSAFGINPTLFAGKLPYDAIQDFAAITNIALTPQTLVASPAFPVKSVGELVALAKAKPGAVSYASLGSGSTSHLTMEMFRASAGIRLNHVPYKGSPAAYTDIMGGQVPIMFDAMPATLTYIKSQRLRALGVAMRERSPFLRDVPTVAEQGYPGFEAIGWIGIMAPAKTPVAVLDKINRDIVDILKKPDVKERFDTMAFIAVGDTREHFAAYIRDEIAKWGKAVKESGAKAE